MVCKNCEIIANFLKSSAGHPLIVILISPLKMYLIHKNIISSSVSFPLGEVTGMDEIYVIPTLDRVIWHLYIVMRGT